MPASDVERCLDFAIAALRMLAVTSIDDDDATIEQRSEAARTAGVALDEAIARVSSRYAPVFARPESDWDDDESVDGPPLTRLSVDVRAAFDLRDEAAFLDAAARMLAAAGAPSPEGSALEALDALVDRFGLDRLTAGDPVAGIECIGGEWGVSAEEPGPDMRIVRGLTPVSPPVDGADSVGDIEPLSSVLP